MKLNQITFKVDRALTREYPGKGYGICIDLTADKTTGTPAVAQVSLGGQEYVTNKVVGVNTCAAWEQSQVKHLSDYWKILKGKSIANS